MPGSPIDYKDLMEALRDENHRYHITREDLVDCAQRIVLLAKKLAG